MKIFKKGNNSVSFEINGKSITFKGSSETELTKKEYDSIVEKYGEYFTDGIKKGFFVIVEETKEEPKKEEPKKETKKGES